MTSPLRIVTLSVALSLCSFACASDSDPHLYRTQAIAPGYTQGEVAGLQRLGATQIAGGINFGVYSQAATRVDLALFDDPEATHPTRQFQMTRIGDVWNLYVEGLGVGQHYGFVAWGPNWPYDSAWHPGSIAGFQSDIDAAGNRFDPNKLLIDPYARAIHRNHDWRLGSAASGPKRTDSTFAAAGKSVVVQSHYLWSTGEGSYRAGRLSATTPGHGWNDLIIYEVHPKGFTASPASAVDHPGTFRGIGEKADYFKDLGITAVELMPVFQKPLDGGYWGYQTIGFFMPELTYSSKTDPGAPGDEFKWMVDQLHQRGVEVLLDVVYNHTGEGGLWREKIAEGGASLDPSAFLRNFDPKETASLYSFRGLDNQAYYALSGDKQTYWDNTGVGNETRCQAPAMRQLILDSLHYWVTEMHVDGFRFDLAPILGEQDLNYNSWDPQHTTLQLIADDPILQRYNTRIIAEPWSLYGFFVGQFPASSTLGGYGWAEWNGPFRDWWRSFENIDSWNLASQENGQGAGFFLSGSYDWYHGNGRRPYHSINFVTVHDGFTMYDLFSYPAKVNGCGPLNPTCCPGDPQFTFCDDTSGEDNNRSRDWGPSGEDTKRQMMRGLFTAMAVSQGTPMLLGGDEWMRTQLGNNNAYSTGADNPFNWFDWGSWQAEDERWRMHDFVRKLLAFRKAHQYAFSPVDYGVGAPWYWRDESNATTPNWNSKHLAMFYYDSSFGPQLDVLINMEAGPVTYILPPGVSWGRALDTQAAFDESASIAPGATRTSQNIGTTEVPLPASYTVQGHSIVVLEELK